MTEVVKFYPANAAENPDFVLEQAAGKYAKVLILGFSVDGGMDFRASHNTDDQDALWLIEYFKSRLMAGCYSDDGDEE